jgi:hypothetical protein
MTKKKRNLADALQSVGQVAPAVRAQRRRDAAKTTREGKKTIAGFFTVEVSNQFKILGINEGKTGQELLAEALNDLFVKHGKPPIA